MTPDDRGKPALTTDRLGGLVLAVFAVLALWESAKLPFGTMEQPGPGTVPVLLALTLLVCSLTVCGGGTARPVSAVQWTEWRHAVCILGTCVFMALAIERLGYRLTILVVLFALVTFLERKSWIAGAIFALAFSLGSHFVFNTLLKVPMPPGPFGF